MSKKKLYKLIVDEEQLSLIDGALELQSRIGRGQLREILQVLRANAKERFCEAARSEAERRLDEVKDLVMGLRGGSYLGIHSHEAHNSNRILYDMHQVIRHWLAWERDPQPTWSTHKDSPSKTSTTDERMMTIAPATEGARKIVLGDRRLELSKLQSRLLSKGLRHDGIDREVARLDREIQTTT